MFKFLQNSGNLSRTKLILFHMFYVLNLRILVYFQNVLFLGELTYPALGCRTKPSPCSAKRIRFTVLCCCFRQPALSLITTPALIFPFLRSVFASPCYAVASGNARSRSSPHSLSLIRTRGFLCSLFARSVRCLGFSVAIPHAKYFVEEFVGCCSVFIVCRISTKT